MKPSGDDAVEGKKADEAAATSTLEEQLNEIGQAMLESANAKRRIRSIGRGFRNYWFSFFKEERVMSGELDLYCELRDIAGPAEKARAVVEALATLRQERSARAHTKALQQLQGELDSKLWDLKFKAMTDEITIKFGVFMLVVIACEIILHLHRLS